MGIGIEISEFTAEDIYLRRKEWWKKEDRDIVRSLKVLSQEMVRTSRNDAYDSVYRVLGFVFL